MSNTVKQLGFIPTNRGEYDTTGQTRYYKDNVVQYRNGSYICTPVGYSSSNPTAYTTDAPYQDGDTELNPNWELMASVGLVDEEPVAGSDSLVKSGGVAKFIGIQNYSINGNGADWRIRTLEDLVLNNGESVIIELSGNITFAGTSDTQAFLLVYCGSTTKFYIQGNTPFAPLTLNITATADNSNIRIEGRWHPEEVLHVKAETGFTKNVHNSITELKTKQSRINRGLSRVVTCNSLNFDNTNHKAIISEAIVCDPNYNDRRLSIPASEVDYTFSHSASTVYAFVYDLSDSTYKFKVAGTQLENDITIALLKIVGVGTTNGKVLNVHWCAFIDCYIDSVNLSTKITALETKQNNINRGLARVIHCNSLNFDNTNKKAILANLLLCDPSSGTTRKTVDSTEVTYTFTQGNSIAYTLVYDLSDDTYKFVVFGYQSINQVTIAIINIVGSTDTTRKVLKVVWCAFEGCYVDGININTRLTDAESGLNFVKSQLRPTELTTDIVYPRVGTIYNGVINTDYVCLYDPRFFPVAGSITCFHASDITVRITEYDSNKTYIKQTGYDDLSEINLQPNTAYIRISAKYSQRGYSSTNPVTQLAWQNNDFGFTYTPNEVVIRSTECLIDKFADKSYFVDGSTWTRINKYNCKIIPVTAGSTIFVKSNDSVNTRIAFINTFDEANILANMPIAVDGTGNQNTPMGGNINKYIVPENCTYIALNSIYANVNSLPVSLVIDGIEYCKPSTDDFNAAIEYFTNAVDGVEDVVSNVNNIEKGKLTNILGRNMLKDAAVRATGKKAVNDDILPLSFIHISDIHTKSNNYKCFENACEFYQNYSNIKAMIVTGDIVWDDFRDTTDWYNIALQKTTKPVYNVIGNHDAGQYHVDLTSQSNDKQCYDKFIAPYVSGWGVVQPTDAATEGKSYYYKDFVDEKIRLIVLNEFETDYEINSDGTALVYSREIRAMRQAQVTWLIDTLGSTPSDYGVIVAYHQPDNLAEEDNAFVSFDLVGSYRSAHGLSPTAQVYYYDDTKWLPKILNAFATKSSLELTVTHTGAVRTSSPTLVCDCDFTNVQAEFICILNGHTHRDYIGHLADYPALKVLCVGADNLLYTSSFQPREANTPSEDLFNVVNIDRNRKTIKIIRIGSDASVTGQVRDQMIMSYA